MELKQRLAWIHLAATTLPTDESEIQLVELKFHLKDLVEQATAAHDIVKAELQAQRQPGRRAQ